MSKGFNVSANWRRSRKPDQEQHSPGPQKTGLPSLTGLSDQPGNPEILEKFQKDFNKIPVSQVGLPGWITGPAKRTGQSDPPGKLEFYSNLF